MFQTLQKKEEHILLKPPNYGRGAFWKRLALGSSKTQQPKHR